MIMKVLKIGLLTAFILLSSEYIAAQIMPKTVAVKSTSSAVKSSPAYAELLLRRVERESELEEFALNYTDEFPKVKEIKFELNLINQEMDRIMAVNAADVGKLTLALGKLMVRKTEIGTDLYNLHLQYTDERPEVKRLRRKIEIYEKAIKEILP